VAGVFVCGGFRVVEFGLFDRDVSAPTVHEMISDVLSRRASRIEIDLSGVTFLDSAGIRMLLMCHADAARADCELALVDPHPRVYRVLQITGLLDHFHLTPEPAGSDRVPRPR
jgi:anti-anti-sigma factor